MDFALGFPGVVMGDSIWVIVDRLTKSAFFIPVRTIHTMDKLAELYIQNIVRLHRVPCSIIFDRESRFTSCFWNSLQLALETRHKAYHPQTDEQLKRTIQMLEAMLRACALDFPGTWKEFLPLVKFSYNNSLATIEMALYKALYGRKC